MTKQPCSTRDNSLRLRLVSEAVVKAGEVNNDPRMTEAGKRALRLAEKANREGKARTVTDDEGTYAIIDK